MSTLKAEAGGLISRGKAVYAWAMNTLVGKAYQRFNNCDGPIYVAGSTYFAFLSIFPIILLAVAIAAAIASDQQVADLTKAMQEALPGIGDKIDMTSIVRHAGTIGLVSGISLLLAGLGWLDALRRSIRNIWGMEKRALSPILRPFVDTAILIGMAVIAALGAASTAITSVSDDLFRLMGMTDAVWAPRITAGVGYAVAVILSGFLLLYLLMSLAGVILKGRTLAWALVVSGIVAEAIKQFGTLAITYFLEKNAAYGALALPLALLLWINLMLTVTMLSASWVCELRLKHQRQDAEAKAREAGVLPWGASLAAAGAERAQALADPPADAAPTRSKGRPSFAARSIPLQETPPSGPGEKPTHQGGSLPVVPALIVAALVWLPAKLIGQR